jgi:hypothetical protein
VSGLCAGALATALFGACSGGTSGEVEPLSGPTWTLEGPAIELGDVDDPDYAFTEVRGMAEGPDGTLYSIHFGDARVWRWTDVGPLPPVGREGQGPGEFSTTSDLGFFGDSLWVWDSSNHRVSFFDTAGRFLSSVSPPLDMGERGGPSPPRHNRPLRDGRFYGRQPAWSQEIATGELTETAQVVMEADGAIVREVWLHPHEPRDQMALLREDGSGGSFGRQPFADGVLSDVTDEDLVVVERRAWEGEGPATFTVTRIDFLGDTIASKAVAYAPAPLPAERVDSAVEARTEELFPFMSEFQPGLARGTLEQNIREATYEPSHLPPVRNLLVASDGSVWLERGPTSDGLIEWLVLGPGLESQARALVPAGVELRLVVGDRAWGVRSDAFDVQYIVRYEIVGEST